MREGLEMADARTRLTEVLADLVASGRESGLQLAVYLDGELVVDACAGVADARTGRAVDSDTLFYLFSCGKGVTATAAHLLAERGVLDYDAPIAAHWPEFAAHGKDRITLRHALTHSAGIPRLPAGTTLGDVCDWERACGIVAALVPEWAPGSRTEYHAETYGWLVGETIRRADGRRVDQVVRDEVTGPLGIGDDLALGIPDALHPRMAHHTADDHGPDVAPADLAAPLAAVPAAAQANHPARRRACVPSSCVGTARGLARMYAALAAGGSLDGVRILSPDRVTLATRPAVTDVDAGGAPVSRALGYLLGSPSLPLRDPGVFGHDGLGESVGFADPARRFAFALARTHLTNDWSRTSTTHLIADQTRAALGLAAEPRARRRG
ncbi:serine hydrolase domain-containing protein [Streptomyces sp. B6B3]|uniref:serine hydrolase domain-containing protein n=1 Tax=Streptomyces sp. B6B3 TaxID=3153570 RepID=UPI00325FBD3A